MTAEFKSAKFYRYQLNVVKNERLKLELEKENSEKVNAIGPESFMIASAVEAKAEELLTLIYKKIEESPNGFVFFEFPTEYSNLYGRDDDHSWFLQNVYSRVFKRLNDKGFETNSDRDGTVEIRF